MSNAQPTLGPWKIGESAVCKQAIFEEGGVGSIACVRGYVSPEIDKENARLIVAARNAIGDDFSLHLLEGFEFGGLTKRIVQLQDERDELLEALEQITGGLDASCDSHPKIKANEVKKARAAIAKATQA